MYKLKTPKHPAGSSTGPLTDEGKQRSSLNAFRHGATSGRWLSSSELTDYLILLKELGDYYASDNPLVAMQVERIARLRVQLGRIQEVIDATFHVERHRGSSPERLKSVLDITSEDIAAGYKREFKSMMSGGQDTGAEEVVLRTVLTEAGNAVQLAEVTTHEEFADIAPTFCALVLAQARVQGIALAALLEGYVSSGWPWDKIKDKSSPTKFDTVVEAMVRPLDGTGLSAGDFAVIESVKLEALQGAHGYVQAAVQRRLAHLIKLRKVDLLFDPIEAEAVPDLDRLDRLTRYQTTINRQLSAAVGELLAIMREPAPLRAYGAD